MKVRNVCVRIKHRWLTDLLAAFKTGTVAFAMGRKQSTAAPASWPGLGDWDLKYKVISTTNPD